MGPLFGLVAEHPETEILTIANATIEIRLKALLPHWWHANITLGESQLGNLFTRTWALEHNDLGTRSKDSTVGETREGERLSCQPTPNW